MTNNWINAGEAILTAGDPLVNLYFVASGSLEIYQNDRLVAIISKSAIIF